MRRLPLVVVVVLVALTLAGCGAGAPLLGAVYSTGPGTTAGSAAARSSYGW